MKNTPFFKPATRHGSMTVGWARSIAVSLFIAAATWQCTQTGGVDPHSAPERNIAKLDRDDDGKVSRAEFHGPPQRFKALDADGDGYLSAKEMRGQHGAAPHSGSGSADRIPIIDVHVHLDVMTGRRGGLFGSG